MIKKSEICRVGLLFIFLGFLVEPVFADNPFKSLEPGLWESHQTTLVNGQDVMAQMMSSHGAMMKNMTPENKKKFMDQMNAGQQHCVKVEERDKMNEIFLKKQLNSMNGCTSSVDSADSHSMKFTVDCQQGDHYKSKGTMSVVVQNSKAYTFKYANKSFYKTSNGTPQESVMEMNGAAKWLGSNCGTVK